MSWVCSLALVGCGPGDADPTCAVPTAEGFTATAARVVYPGDAEFTAVFDWDGAASSDLRLDLLAGAVGGGTPSFTWEGSERVAMTVPGDRHGWIDALGSMNVWSGDTLCGNVELAPASARVAGGAADRVAFPVDDVALVVGERRVVQATPLRVRPAPNLGGTGNDLTVSDDVIGWASSDEAVVRVEGDGVLVAVAEGAATVTATAASGPSAELPVVVATGEPGPAPEGAWLLTSRFDPEPDSADDGLTRHTVAVGPDGAPVAVLTADVGLVDGVQHTTMQNPVYLARWSGSGLGYERLTDWSEIAENAIVGVDGDGRTYAAWQSSGLAEPSPGFAVVDRPAGVEVGGWRQRALPMAPDGVALARAWPTAEVAVLPVDDGLWVAYAWSGPHDDVPLPATWAHGCAQVLRLAHVTEARIDVEDVYVWQPDFVVAGPECAQHLAVEGRTFTDLALDRPRDGATRPVISTLDQWHRALRFTPVGAGWEVTDFSPTIALTALAHVDSPGVTADPLFSSVRDDPDAFLVNHLAGVAGEAGRWVCSSQVACDWYGEAVAPYSPQQVRPDSLLGPHFPGVYEIDAGDGSWPGSYHSIVGGYGRAAVVTKLPPRDAPPADRDRTWLYLTDLPVAARPDDPLVAGQRLGEAPRTQRYDEAIAFPDGAIGLFSASSSAYVLSAVAGSTDDAMEERTPLLAEGGGAVHWVDGARLLRVVTSGASLHLSASTDQGASFAPAGSLAVSGALVDEVLAAATVAPGVHFVATSQRLFRLVEDGAGGLTGGELPADLPGYLRMMGGGTVTLLPAAGGVTVLWRLVPSGLSNPALAVERYLPDGQRSSSKIADLAVAPMVGKGAVTDAGRLVVPYSGLVEAEFAGLLTSDDGGATWVQSPSWSERDGGGAAGNAEVGPPIVRLGDGRLALVVAWAEDEARLQVAVFTSADGVAWDGPRVVRPSGGGYQSAWAAAALPDGGLFVHYGDSSTVSRRVVQEHWTPGGYGTFGWTNPWPLDAVVQVVPGAALVP